MLSIKIMIAQIFRESQMPAKLIRQPRTPAMFDWIMAPHVLLLLELYLIKISLLIGYF